MAHSEKVKAYMREWRKRPENMERKRVYEAARRKRLPASYRAYDRKRKTLGGIDPPRPEDHDHQTGVFRGWLCDPCNRGLGFLRENPVVLARAADWVRFGGPT